MIGKFLLFAFVSVSFVQGGPLQDAIEQGLLRAKTLEENGQKRIQMAEFDVTSKTKLIQFTVDDLKLKARDDQKAANAAVAKVAQEVEKIATELNKPESVFNCIRKNVENANSQVEILTNKLELDLDRLEKTKLANINTVSKPYDEMPNALTVRYERAVKLIKACKNPGCVETAVNSFATWLKGLYDNIKRIEGQISTATANFQKDSANYYDNTNRQVARIRVATVTNIPECLR